MACAVVGMGVGLACAQTPASQANTPQWKQTPEGRPAATTPDTNCSGQATKGNDGKWTTASNCGSAQDEPMPTNATQQFPYPGEPDGAKQAAPANAPGAQTPGAPNAQQSPKNAAQQFPYPGEQPAAPANSGDVKRGPPGGLQDAGSSGASSSNSSGYSSSDSGLPDGVGPEVPDDTSVPTRTRSSRKRPAQPVMTANQREAEDLQVAGFYQNDGNFRGAYMRAKEAVTIAGDDPEAHFALAEAARKLGKLDEAEQNYKKCLQLDPVPKTKKVVQEALKQMTGGG
jgi:hypothetical protein